MLNMIIDIRYLYKERGGERRRDKWGRGERVRDSRGEGGEKAREGVSERAKLRRNIFSKLYDNLFPTHHNHHLEG